jgi:hypothetical protein
MRDTSEAQPGLRVSLLVARPDADAEGADSVAGCEFLDDRLRLEE